MLFAVFDEVLVDEDETRRIERRLIWLVDCSLGLFDDNDNSLDDNWADDDEDDDDDDDEAADVVDEVLDEEDDSSRTIDLQQIGFIQCDSIERETNGARRRRFSEFVEELFFPWRKAKQRIKKDEMKLSILDCVGSSCPFDDVEQPNSSNKVRIPSKQEIISLSFKSNQYERRWL